MKKTNVIDPGNFFWKDGKELKHLTILNPSDFKEPFEIKSLPSSSLGLADQDEIIARNEVVRFLFKNNEAGFDIGDIASKLKISQERDKGLYLLPDNGSNFLAFYEKENEYWKIVENFINKYEGNAKSFRIESFIAKLRVDKVRLMPLETEMSERISKTLHQVTKMDGIVEMFTQDGCVEKSIVIGQKSYNALWSPNCEGKLPNWAKKWFFKVTGIQTLIQKQSNKKLREESYRSSLITSLPRELERDLEKGINDLLKKRKFELLEKESKKKLTKKEKEILEQLIDFPNLKVTVEFHYDNNGLKIRFLSIKDYLYNEESKKINISISNSQYRGYNEIEEEKIKSHLCQYSEMMKDTVAARQALNIVAFLEKNCKINYDEYYDINSFLTDSIFSHSYLINIYSLDENIGIYQELNKQRIFFHKGIYELSNIAALISDFVSMAESKKLPICVPTVITDKVGINFKNLAPINMIGQDKKMVPFTFPELNGRMICLTGRHGRGKSVAGNSVLETLWLAQSGLPVFAKEFSFDVKDVIGAVINDEGHGSTATVFIQKTKNLLENIAKVPSEKSVIFIDEIGKGTQESAGLVLGKRLLDTMAKKHYSVIFNTQIMALAGYAEQTVQAKCLKVDKNHQFAAGIGEGEMEELVKEMGLDKYLN